MSHTVVDPSPSLTHLLGFNCVLEHIQPVRSMEMSGLNPISFNPVQLQETSSQNHSRLAWRMSVGRSTAPEGISGVLGEYYTIADGGWDLI